MIVENTQTLWKIILQLLSSIVSKNALFSGVFSVLFSSYTCFFFGFGFARILANILLGRVRRRNSLFFFIFFAVYIFFSSYWAEGRVQKRVTSRKTCKNSIQHFPPLAAATTKPFSLSLIHSLLLLLLMYYFFPVFAASSFAWTCVRVCLRERACVYVHTRHTNVHTHADSCAWLTLCFFFLVPLQLRST